MAVCMAVNTFINLVIRIVDVTIRADGPFTAMRAGVNRKILAVVIVGRLIPVGSVVARRTILRELRRLVIRIGGLVVIRLMAKKAVRRRVGVAVGMTINAGGADMRAG